MRKLGRSGIEVAPLAFGGNVFGWTIDEAQSFKLLDAFVDAGFNLVDTADVYSKWAPGNKGGESETIIGNWLKRSGKRNSIVLASKVGMQMSPTEKGLSRKYIIAEVEASLRRLQTDRIDLYQAHQDDPETPLEETMEAFASLVKQGKVRALGASNYDAERLAQALEVSRKNSWPRYETLQPLYNLYDRAGFEEKLQGLCTKEEIGVIPYYALASGFLTGKYRSETDFGKSARGQGMSSKLNERGLRILGALDQVAEARKATPAKVALAWLAARPSIAAPIASATSLAQFEELVAATRLELDQKSMALLDQASA